MPYLTAAAVVGAVTLALAAVALYVRALKRQVDALRADVAVARIEGVLGQQPRAGGTAMAPAPARGKS